MNTRRICLPAGSDNTPVEIISSAFKISDNEGVSFAGLPSIALRISSIDNAFAPCCGVGEATGGTLRYYLVHNYLRIITIN
jgi:hypothetical protein